jgi:hypothetical protein
MPIFSILQLIFPFGEWLRTLRSLHTYTDKRMYVICSEQFGPGGFYIHHYPHYNKPHDFHEPGFAVTLKLYREVGVIVGL